MGNFVTVPSLNKHKKPVTPTDVNINTITKPEKNDRHIVHHNMPMDSESKLWVRVKKPYRRKPQTNKVCTTRYNIITFLPKNLFEQFHRIANIYFAILIGLNWVPALSAISRNVAFIPLTVILVITAVKDLVEDLKRWRSDSRINKQLAMMFDRSTNTFVQCQWQDLSVGSIIRVNANDAVPADIILLSSSSKEDTCFLDTAAIDGETNLKQKTIPSCFLNIEYPETESFEIQCDLPNDDIYHFHGRLTLYPSLKIYSLDNANLLLRGCVLRITDYVDGIVIYAGNQTKIIKSSHHSASKRSLIEQFINRDVVASAIILTILCLVSAGFSVYWGQSFSNWQSVSFILDDPWDNVAAIFFTSALRFVILFQVMVPIALYVSLDIVRIIQMRAIASDKHLKYEHPISCRTFTINEDLGQIGYIFSDKTGTLTQNKLVFKSVSIGGIHYKDNNLELPVEDETVRYFLTALAVCNTVFIVNEHPELIDRIEFIPKYEADNADDLCLCQAAASLYGVRMMSKTAQKILVRYIDKSQNVVNVELELLCLLPFDSTRKRMSIIVRMNNQIFLFIKGAETSIWPHLNGFNNEVVKANTEQHIHMFAERGYRSLLVAYRQLTLTEFEEWYQCYTRAANLLEGREEAISETAVNIERNLILTGVTAVEDKLQDGVPESIESLRLAGIKIWLLTGDKQATALSIAQAASLIHNVQHNTMENITISGAFHATTTTQTRQSASTFMCYYSSNKIEAEQELGRDTMLSIEELTTHTLTRMSEIIAAHLPHVCMIVTGDDLQTIFKYKAKEFIKIAADCESVMYCRVSATQKRELVTVAKQVFKSRILSIGDGANDVGMLREAHCGVAVFGREGSQAVAVGDFAVDRFECLRYLLLVHGAWCFSRTTELILYTFMHNAAYVFLLFFHQIFNGFSGAVTLHSMYLILYTSLFTVLPQCAAALFDEHISADAALKNPELYQYTLKAKPYRIYHYWINFFDAVWQSACIFFIAYFAYLTNSEYDELSFGLSLICSMTITSLIHVLLQATRIGMLLGASVILSLLVFLGFTLIFDITCVTCLPAQSPYGVAYHVFKDPLFYLVTLLTCVCAMTPRYLIKCVYNSTVNPLIKYQKLQSTIIDTHF